MSLRVPLGVSFDPRMAAAGRGTPYILEHGASAGQALVRMGSAARF
jgi:hypothetical protein